MMKRLPLILIAALALLTGCTTVNPGHVGVEVHKMGTQRGVDDFPQRTGLVFYNPFATSIIEYPTFVQTASWTRPGDGTNRDADESITFTNRDNLSVNVDVSLSYHLVADKVPAFYMMFRSDDLTLFTHSFLRNVTRDAFNESGGKYAIEQIMGDNGPFLAEVRQKVQEQVTPYGVVIDQFGIIGSPHPPQSVIDAINLKVQATQTALQKQNEVAQKQAEAQMHVAEAEGYAKSQVIRAKGEADANRIRNEAITANILKMRALDNQHDAIYRWDGVMPKMTTDGKSLNLLMQAPGDN